MGEYPGKKGVVMKKTRPTRKRTNKPVGKRGHGQRSRIEDLDKIIENGQLVYEDFWIAGVLGQVLTRNVSTD